jgi:hypothetical protein
VNHHPARKPSKFISRLERHFMKKCPILLAIKNDRMIATPLCPEECILKIKGRCLLKFISEYTKKIVSALTERN